MIVLQRNKDRLPTQKPRSSTRLGSEATAHLKVRPLRLENRGTKFPTTTGRIAAV